MKYKELPEPHRSLLFKLVEFYRKHAERHSGLIPFYDEPLGLTLYLKPDAPDIPDAYKFRLGPYHRGHLTFLEKEAGYVSLQEPDIGPDESITVTQQAINYYDYMHSPAWRQRWSDFCYLTGPYWLKTVIGLAGTLLGWFLRSLLNWP